MFIPTTRRHPHASLLPLLLLGAALSALGAPHPVGAASRALTASPPTHAGAHGVRLTVAAGTSADYRAREQLTFFSFPTDAVGTTSAVTGSIVLDAHGRIVPAQSRFVIDLRTLKSDKSQRDQFIQANTLQTAQYPNAVFKISTAVGLPAALPTTGVLHFSLVGTLTVHGVTRPTTWTVSATLGRHTVSGVATTQVKLTAFGMTPPQVGPVLSVNDTLTLEIKAQMARASV